MTKQRVTIVRTITIEFEGELEDYINLGEDLIQNTGMGTVELDSHDAGDATGAIVADALAEMAFHEKSEWGYEWAKITAQVSYEDDMFQWAPELPNTVHNPPLPE